MSASAREAAKSVMAAPRAAAAAARAAEKGSKRADSARSASTPAAARAPSLRVASERRGLDHQLDIVITTHSSRYELILGTSWIYRKAQVYHSQICIQLYSSSDFLDG